MAGAAVAIRRAGPADLPAILALWRRSVDATHDFVAPADRDAIGQAIATAFVDAPILVAVDANDAPAGFLLVDGDGIGALFVDPDRMGGGIGSALVAAAPGSVRVDVNEANARARGFYERHGFAVTGRSPVDGDGRPYPILHMRRPAHG